MTQKEFLSTYMSESNFVEAEKDLQNMINDVHDEAYNEGHTVGYESGQGDGYESGYTAWQDECPESKE